MGADPVTMAIGGAALGGIMDKKNPLRGAALGGLGGYFAGPALSEAAGGAAAGGTGLSMGAGGVTGLQAMPSAMASAGGQVGISAAGPMAEGMGAQGLVQGTPSMMSGVPSSLAISPQKMIEMGGKMAMQGNGQQRPQQGMAAPAIRPPLQGPQDNFADLSPYAGILGTRRVPVL